MKTLFLLAALCLPASAADNFYQLKARTIDGEDVALSQYKGKVALVVNTASRCGFTPQFQQLQAVYDKYKDKGLIVLGFPSNDFHSQDPGTNGEIKNFCQKNYGVTFPMFEKNPVKGKDTQPVFVFLKASPVGSKDGEISWNFNKFLIGRDGAVAARYGSRTKPDDAKVLAELETLLAAQAPAAKKGR